MKGTTGIFNLMLINWDLELYYVKELEEEGLELCGGIRLLGYGLCSGIRFLESSLPALVTVQD